MPKLQRPKEARPAGGMTDTKKLQSVKPSLREFVFVSGGGEGGN